MLPLAVLGSIAAWPSFRTLSAFRILYLGLCAGALIWLVRERRPLPRVRVLGFLVFLAFWVAWTVLSLLWAGDKAAGMRYTLFLIMMTSLTAAAPLALNNTRTVRVALLLLLAVLGMALCFALLEIATDFRLPTSGLVGLPERYQWAATSFFHNQNDFATYIALWLPLLVAVPFFTRKVAPLACTFVGSMISALCLLYTGSRTNLLALGLMAPALLIVLALRKGTSSQRWQWILGLALLCALAVTIYLGASGQLPVLSLPWVGVQHWRFDTLEAEIEAGEGSGGNRIKLIEGGLAAIRDSRLLGLGPGNAESYLRQRPGLELVHNLHNWWLEVLVNGGIVVFVGYVVFYAALLWNLLRVAVGNTDRVMAFAATGLLAALVGYIVGSLSPSSAIHFTPMWIHFGLSLAVINLHRRRVSEQSTVP
ncbi:MAG: O-antigen ligase family protein [Anaerolineae bacterium]|nr:O-antigen ligase family protein [Anaerolineae bacterium]